MGVMGTSSQIDADPLEERCAGCRNRGARRTPRTFHHLGRPGKSNRALIGLIEIASAKAADPVWMMRKRQLPVGRSGRFNEFHLRQALLNRRTEQGIFPHGESMLRREREHELITVEGLHKATRIDT
jgi:hypothetical protein